MKSKILVLTFALSMFPLKSFSQGQSGAGGGNDIDSKSIAQYLVRFNDMSEATSLKALISKIASKIPEFAQEMNDAAKGLKFYIIDLKNPALPSQVTGLYFDTQQTAIHQKNGEVFTDAKLYNKKSSEEKLYFLTQELLEEQVMKKHVGIDMQRMHSIARSMTDILIRSSLSLSESDLQQKLIDEGIGYYSTATQISASKNAELHAPVLVDSKSNVIILKNGQPIDSHVQQSFRVGDKVRFEITARDPQGSQIQYHFGVCWDGPCDSLGESFDGTFEYTFKAEEARRGHGSVYIELTNDLVKERTQAYILEFTVSDGTSRLPPVIKQVKAYKNGTLLDLARTPTPKFIVGDKLDIEIEANDPQGAQIHYQYGVCWDGPCDSWGSSLSNRFSHVFTAEDARHGYCSPYIELTNDLVTQRSQQYVFNSASISTGKVIAPPSITKIEVFKNGVLVDRAKPQTYSVGDKLKITVHAKDPQGAVIHYGFGICWNGPCDGWTNSTQNSYEYVIKADDVKQGRASPYVEVTNDLIIQRSQEYALNNMTITDGTSRVPPELLDSKVQKLKLRTLSKQEASDLKNYLQAQDSHSCASIITSLDDFIKDQDRTRMEALAWFTNGIDDATALCLKLVTVGLKSVLH